MQKLLPTLLIIIGAIIALGSALSSKSQPVTKLEFRELASAMVKVTKTDSESGGTGFVLRTENDKLVVISNAHVCDNDRMLKLTDSAKNTSLVLVKKIDRKADLCLMPAPKDARPFMMAPMPSNQYERIWSLGYPYLEALRPHDGYNLGVETTVMFQSEITNGGKCPDYTKEKSVDTLFGPRMICIIERNLVVTSIETWPGNSGSPVLNDAAEVVGVINSGHREIHSGNFIPLEELKEFLKDE